MDEQLAFRVFINEKMEGSIRSMFNLFADSINEFSDYDVIEGYLIDPSDHELKRNYFSGNKSYYSSIGNDLSLIRNVFQTKSDFSIQNTSAKEDGVYQNNNFKKTTKWKYIFPIMWNVKCIGVVGIFSEKPFSQNEKLVNLCKSWANKFAKQYSVLYLQNEHTDSINTITNSLQTITDLIFEVDQNFEITFSNDSFKRFIIKFSGIENSISELSLKKIFGSEFTDLISGIQKALNGERNYCSKKILINGTEKNYYFIFSPAIENETKCFCYATELSVLEPNDFKNKKSNSGITDSLVQLIADIVWVIDEKGTIKFVNSSFERITGYKPEEVVGRSSFEFFSKDDFPNHLKQMLMYLSGKNTDEYFEFKFIDKQGKSIVLESVAINQLDHDEIKGIVVSARNITKQHAEWRELKEKEELYHSLFESLSEAILITDKNNFLVYCNTVLSIITGYTMLELGSMPLFQLIMAEEYWERALKGTTNQLKACSEQYEVELVCKNGVRIWAAVISAPYKNKNNEIVGCVCTLTDITERKKTEDEIKWLAKFPEENPSPIIRISNTGKILFFNKSAEYIIKFIGLDGDLKTEWQTIISKQIHTKVISKIDIDIDGHYYNLTITPLINNSYFNIYATEITDRIVFQKQLLESEQRLQFLMNSTTEGIIVHDNGIIIDINQAICRIVGYNEDEILGKSTLFFASENSIAIIKENTSKDLSGPYEAALIRKDGSEIKVEITGRAHFYKGRKVKVVAIRDITLRKKVEKLSQENEERLKYFFSITAEGILFIDDEKIIDVNTAFLKITGFSSNEILNKKISELSDISLRENLITLLYSTKNIETEFRLKTKAAKDLIVEVNSQMQEYLGRLIRVIVIRDITQQKKEEEEILLQKKTAVEAQQAEEQFLAKMSHEIRTPMNGIIGLTDILLKAPTSSVQEEYLKLIKHSADNLLVIINDILDLSKIRSGKIEFELIDINLSELMRGIYMATNSTAIEKKLEYNFSIDKRIPEIIKGDRVRLNQIFLNLISNAIKFTEKGKVHFGAELIRKEGSRIIIEFKISDSGIGIPESESDKIFEAYRQASADTTRKFGGTGLGLPIVKQLVEMQGGEIKLQSKVGVGSIFHFALPFEFIDSIEENVSEQKVSINKKLTELAIEKNGICILLVDDNFINRLLVIHLLEDKGYSVIEAENGYQAIDKLNEEEIDLVLMDISMPDLDGLEATRIIRKMDKAYLRKIPIIAMTAHAYQEQIDQAIEAGMNDYLSKPFKPEELFVKINAQLKITDDTNFENEKEMDLNEKQYDLSFLTQYYDNEQEFINSILVLYVKETPISINQIETALNKKDWTTFKSLAHKIKTNIMMMGIKKAEPFLHDVAAINIDDVDEEKMNSSFKEFKKLTTKAIEQIAVECL